MTTNERLHRRAIRLEWFTVSWNVVEAVVAITAGVLAGSVALVGFGVDSGIEVLSAVALLWRLNKAGADASLDEHEKAERGALYAVAATFFLLATYIGFEQVTCATYLSIGRGCSTVGPLPGARTAHRGLSRPGTSSVPSTH